MKILKVCSLGPTIRRLLERFGEYQELMMKAGRYYGHPFRTERGVTQGDPVFPHFSTSEWMQW